MNLYNAIFTLKKKEKSNRSYHNNDNLGVAFFHSCTLYRLCTDFAPPSHFILTLQVKMENKQKAIEKKEHLASFRKRNKQTKP